jgi:2-phosphosulfolactate phosphatase
VADRPWLHQSDWNVRFEWGPAGVESVPSEAVVVVDVLRFTTAVDAAVSRGAVVFPYRWRDDSAGEYAARVGAVLADAGDPLGPSLSPVSLLSLKAADRIVLPSPNGSTCAAAASAMGATVVAGCLRNANAVASWLNDRAETVTVIACGERWPDRSLRPSLEDYLGAGAVIAALGGTRSPEATAAADSWLAAAARVGEVVSACASGREAVARGWERDLEFAVAVNASESVPVLEDGFVDANW